MEESTACDKEPGLYLGFSIECVEGRSSLSQGEGMEGIHPEGP